MESLIVIGGGEHARVVIDAARSAPDRFQLHGFVDPAAPAEALGLGLRCFESDEAALAQAAGHCFIVALGPLIGSRTRQQVIERYTKAGARFVSVVHPRATVSNGAHVAVGVTVLANAVVNVGAYLGDHSVINTGAIIEHDVRIGEEAHVAPGAVIGGGTRIGRRAHIGLGARVRDHVVLDDEVVVGMGAAVVRSSPGAVRLLGVPARVKAR